MQRNLTARFIDSLKPRPGKRVTVFDAKTTGLAIRKTSAGHVGYYVMSRKPAGDQVWAEIKDGNAPVTSLGLARELAPQGIANIKNGRAAYPKIEPPLEAETYERVVERFIRQAAKPNQRTWKQTERVLKAVPWGARPFADITKKDANGYLSDLAMEKPAAARVALSWLKSLWRWAARMDIVPYPIMDVLQAKDFGIRKKTRDQTYTDDQIKALWTATGELSSHERAFLKLSILLSVRKGALVGLRKRELDDPKKPTLWTVPTERVKVRKSTEDQGRVYQIPIPPLASRVLVPLLKGDGDLVFPSAARKDASMVCGTALAKKVREASGVADWTHHAHRHTVATWLQDQGHDEYDRALVLQHAGAGTVTAGYSHGYSLDRARELLEKWAKHVGAVVAAEGVELMA